MIFICTYCASLKRILDQWRLKQSKSSPSSPCPHCFNVKLVLNQCYYLKQHKTTTNKVHVGSMYKWYFNKLLCSNIESMLGQYWSNLSLNQCSLNPHKVWTLWLQSIPCFDIKKSSVQGALLFVMFRILFSFLNVSCNFSHVIAPTEGFRGSLNICMSVVDKTMFRDIIFRLQTYFNLLNC